MEIWQKPMTKTAFTQVSQLSFENEVVKSRLFHLGGIKWQRFAAKPS